MDDTSGLYEPGLPHAIFGFSTDLPAESILQNLNVTVFELFINSDISSFQTCPKAVTLSGTSSGVE